jgi:hypothetical protein
LSMNARLFEALSARFGIVPASQGRTLQAASDCSCRSCPFAPDVPRGVNLTRTIYHMKKRSFPQSKTATAAISVALLLSFPLVPQPLLSEFLPAL